MKTFGSLEKAKATKKKTEQQRILRHFKPREKKINSVAISVDVVDFGSQLKMNHNDFHHTHTHTQYIT